MVFGVFSKNFFLCLGAVVFLFFYFFPLGLEPQAQAVIAITALSMVLWISEAIPLHATALLAAFLLVVAGGFSPDKVFAQFFDRVVVLVLGGFVLAVALSKHHLDEFLAHKVLGRFSGSAGKLLLGVIAVTAFLSMWMSNSAAAAIAMPIALVILSNNNLKPLESRFGKSMVLGVAYGATIGGIGTLIGSTPNVLTQKFLAQNGVQFGFLEWGVRGFPFMVVMVAAAWLVLKTIFRPEIKKVEIARHSSVFSREQKMVAGVFVLTVLLWVTESIHGIHNSIIALVPIVLLYVLGLVDTKDFQKAGWDSLILIGGGIALGMAIHESGLDALLSNFLGGALSNQPLPVILFLLGVAGIMLTGFLSNTAASAVLIPIVTSLSAFLGLDMANLVVAGAIGVSLDFMFPMGTPPSALAYSTGYIHPLDMVKAGFIISIIGALAIAAMGALFWGF